MMTLYVVKLPACPPTFAELLLAAARDIDRSHSPGGVLIPQEGALQLLGAELLCGRAKLVLDFRRRGPAFALRAIVEGWDRERIVREMY